MLIVIIIIIILTIFILKVETTIFDFDNDITKKGVHILCIYLRLFY